MRFEGNKRGVNRSDYEQFAKFLGINQPKCQRESVMPRKEVVETECPISEKYPLAMVYAPKQCFERVYEVGVALGVGTIFEELNKPFYPTGCKGNGKEGCL